MGIIRTMASIKIEFLPGSDLKEAVHEALRIAKILNIRVEFWFNGDDLKVYPTSDPAEIIENFFNPKPKKQ